MKSEVGKKLKNIIYILISLVLIYLLFNINYISDYWFKIINLIIILIYLIYGLIEIKSNIKYKKIFSYIYILFSIVLFIGVAFNLISVFNGSIIIILITGIEKVFDKFNKYINNKTDLNK